jgi:hypothetical protein
MPMKLATTLRRLQPISNFRNKTLLLEFHEYLKDVDTTQNYQNQMTFWYAFESTCPWWKWSVILMAWVSSYVWPVLRTCFGVFANGTVLHDRICDALQRMDELLHCIDCTYLFPRFTRKLYYLATVSVKIIFCCASENQQSSQQTPNNHRRNIEKPVFLDAL